MVDFFKGFKSRYHIVLQLSIFVCSVALITYFYPKQGKYAFEYQKGMPWMHNDLQSTFDFPINKTKEEIQKDKDSVLKDYIPYFINDNKIIESQLNLFTKKFEDAWSIFIESDEIAGKSNITKNKQAYLKHGLNALKDVYSFGILESTDGFISQQDSIYEVYINQEDNAQKFIYAEAYSLKQAYNNLKQRFSTINAEPNLPYLLILYKKIDASDFIVPNLIYNSEISEKVKLELLNSVSETSGMIEAKQLIISKGEIITHEKFKILESHRQEYTNNVSKSKNWVILGIIIFITICFVIIYFFLFTFRTDILYDILKTTFILFLIVLTVTIAIISQQFTSQSLYIIPIALLPIIIRAFYDTRLALFIHMITILIIGFISPNGYEFVFLSFATGITAIFTLANQYRRGRLFLTSALVTLTYSLGYIAIAIIHEGKIDGINPEIFLWFLLNGLFLMTASPLIYMFEKMFGFISDATLIELADTNQKLLRRLAEIAPGTFQHSIQVANMAEEAVRQVGGNSLLVRTGALYHDIGKMDNPDYFIENQNPEFNPHDKLEFDESARIIIEHVQKGIDLAKKNNLPEALIDFIRTHHGTSTVQYFYKNYIKKYPSEDVDVQKFTYLGPKPTSKEMAVLMMADSVEAASRSISQYTVDKISTLVDDIIDNQAKNEQFNETNITFKDIIIVKGIFKQKLKNIYHTRIQYPV